MIFVILSTVKLQKIMILDHIFSDLLDRNFCLHWLWRILHRCPPPPPPFDLYIFLSLLFSRCCRGCSGYWQRRPPRPSFPNTRDWRFEQYFYRRRSRKVNMRQMRWWWGMRRTAVRSRGERPYNTYRGYIGTDVKFQIWPYNTGGT